MVLLAHFIIPADYHYTMYYIVYQPAMFFEVFIHHLTYNVILKFGSDIA